MCLPPSMFMSACVAACAGAVLGCALLDTWGRRPVFLISGAGAAASYLVMVAALMTHSDLHNPTSATAIDGWLRVLLHAGVILSYVSGCRGQHA